MLCTQQSSFYSAGMTKRKDQTAAKIRRTADHLFYAEGLRAVGVDKLAEEAGVTKRTLYKHFPTKDDLILSYLKRRHEATISWMTQMAEARGDGAEGRVLALFDVL